MLSKRDMTKINEMFEFSRNNRCFIHHPITDDIISVIIKEVKHSTLIVSIPEQSEYFGQPDFEIKKYDVISLNETT